MSNTASNSAIGNMVLSRQRLSAIRNRVGLESPVGGGGGTGGMRQIQPTNSNGPANNPGAAYSAVRDDADFDPDQHVLDPEKEAKMLSHISGWLDENGDGLDDRTGKPAPQTDPSATSQPAPSPSPAPAQSNGPQPPEAQAALKPLAEFHKKNGRLPTPEELRSQSIIAQLTQQLGRQPSMEEVALYLQKPPKV